VFSFHRLECNVRVASAARIPRQLFRSSCIVNYFGNSRNPYPPQPPKRLRLWLFIPCLYVWIVPKYPSQSHFLASISSLKEILKFINVSKKLFFVRISKKIVLRKKLAKKWKNPKFFLHPKKIVCDVGTFFANSRNLRAFFSQVTRFHKSVISKKVFWFENGINLLFYMIKLWLS